ncbi:VWA domain-containing protein [Stratiformator vulcanicus]|uniref:VWFA domain-containing protein n=1 Tax=Stratiformator vulcanicus TaxID=2527980 RepID=A0A517QW56_9PLAN|nr:VWA domain-containing protein [Stratiformator vulcanicus]QDT35808.1 hypothetical protein Pan189_01610 [Stratiformator vulcanicus]
MSSQAIHPVSTATASAPTPEPPQGREKPFFHDLGDRVGAAPAWAISAAVHLALLLCFGGIYYEIVIETVPDITSEMEEVDFEEYKFENAVVTEEIGNDSPINIASPSKAAATEAGMKPQVEMQQQIHKEIAKVETPVLDEIPPPNQMELVEQLDLSGTTEHPGGVEGAVDILTQEIAASLRERETVVIWLFDASLSLKDRRDAIADRFESIYAQLGQLEEERSKSALETVIAIFGNDVAVLTERPTSDIAELAEKVRNIPADESGNESVFMAVNHVTDRFLRERTRARKNMMLIVVTDERGDDYALVEPTVSKLKRYSIKTYCVGDAAPFGREKGRKAYVMPEGDTMMLPVDQGPETVYPERLQLGFWGGRFNDLELMSSGYGPYALTRLCAETGGLYLLTDEPRVRFDPTIMRRYLPDYRPIAIYERALVVNKAKAALVQSATATQADSVPQPTLLFPAKDDNELRRAVTDAQQPIAVYEYHVNRLVALLSEGEKDRPKLTEPRWQASFDLAMGRALAQQARAFGYNVVLADMKSSPKPFQGPQSDQWRLVPSTEIAGGPRVRKIAEKAEEYLKSVIDDHSGTPWAMIAERELSIPMGWAWQEQYSMVERFGERARDPDVVRLLLAEEEQRREERTATPKPKRNLPKL